MDEPKAGQWLTLAEVRDRTRRNMDGLRSWAKRGARSGKLRVRKSNKGEVQVLVTPEALAASTYDNFSTRGNFNPYTGQPGYRSPDPYGTTYSNPYRR